MNLDKEYWNNRYLENNTPWDAGVPTTPIKKYVDSLNDKSIKILIPGAGNAHEAQYLFNNDFKNVWICDWANYALEKFAKTSPDFPKSQLLNADFFTLSQRFDLIIEQTFFCALSPTLREDYVSKTAALLHNQGRLVGLLFANPFPFEGPPFGGTKEEYHHLFSQKFKIEKLENCYNSMPPRQDNELFINFLKRN